VACAKCHLTHARGDEKNRITPAVVAGELKLTVDTVTKYVTRARAGRKRFPLPVTPANSRMLFDACEIARHRYQMTTRVERAVRIEVARIRREHDAAIEKAIIENATLDVQIERLTLELHRTVKTGHRTRLKEFLRELHDNEAEFRTALRAIEQELKMSLSGGLR
jgi:hypothetical protein